MEKIIGVPHSTIRYWDLRHYDTQINKSLKDLPQPDMVAVNGPMAWNMLERAGYPMSHCFPVEALRYQYLNSQLSIRQRTPQKNKVKRLLVLGDIQKDGIIHQMITHLEEAYLKLDKKIKIWIKLTLQIP